MARASAPGAGRTGRVGRGTRDLNLRNALFYMLLRSGAWLVHRLPLRVAYALSGAGALVAFRCIRTARRGIESNLGLALPDLPADVRRRLALAAFRHDAMNWIDTLRIPTLSPEEILKLVEVDRWDLIDDALASGNGVVLCMLHVGNYDYVGQALVARGISFTIPVERISPERLQRFLVSLRAVRGISIIPAEEASRPLLKALRNGEMVGIAADRHVGGKSVEVDFLGHTCEFPRGPAALARRTGARLLVGVGIRRGGSSFRGFVLPVPLEHTSDANADEARATQHLASIAESFIRAYPGQWLAFTPLRAREHTGGKDLATIRRHFEPVRHGPER